jgi:hypothetical protein
MMQLEQTTTGVVPADVYDNLQETVRPLQVLKVQCMRGL